MFLFLFFFHRGIKDHHFAIKGGAELQDTSLDNAVQEMSAGNLQSDPKSTLIRFFFFSDILRPALGLLHS